MTPAATRDPRLGVGKSTQERLETREIGQMSVRASIRPESLNDDARTVEVTWSTGARVLRGFGGDKWYEELSMDPAHVRMDRLASGNAPVLDAHSSWSSHYVHGVVENARIENGAGFATLRFSDDPDSDLIFQKIRSKILCSVSVGYAIHRLELVEDGDGDIPVYRATDWTPAEISVVPIPADPDATVRSGERTHPCVFVTRAADQEPVTMAKETKTPEVEPKALEQRSAPVAPPIDEAAIRKAERSRIASITRSAGVMSLDKEFLSKHVEAGTSADEFRALAEDEYDRSKPPVADDASRAPSVTAGEDEKEKWQRGAGNWLIARSGNIQSHRDAAKLTGEKLDLDPGRFRGMTLLRLAEESLVRSGRSVDGMSKNELVGEALTYRSGYHATGDFPILLQNVLHKQLLASHAIVADTWRKFVTVGSVGDYKPHYQYRTGGLGVLDAVAEGGEYKTKPISDAERESIALAKAGNILSVTRELIINDDMGGLSDLAAQLGRAAGLSVEVAAFLLLAENANLGPTMGDGKTLFHADHNNIGVGAVISVASVDADAVLMGNQADPGAGAEILDIEPDLLLLPRVLRGAARTVNEDKWNHDAASKLQKSNTSRGTYREIVATNRLSGTRRYSFASPADHPVLKVVFLDGNETPYMETKEGFTRDGVDFKVRLEFKIGAIGWRGAVVNAGV